MLFWSFLTDKKKKLLLLIVEPREKLFPIMPKMYRMYSPVERYSSGQNDNELFRIYKSLGRPQWGPGGACLTPPRLPVGLPISRSNVRAITSPPVLSIEPPKTELRESQTKLDDFAKENVSSKESDSCEKEIQVVDFDAHAQPIQHLPMNPLTRNRRVVRRHNNGASETNADTACGSQMGFPARVASAVRQKIALVCGSNCCCVKTENNESD